MSTLHAQQLAGLLTFAVFFGASWARHTRAQTDLAAARAGLQRATQVARQAGLVFGGAIAVAVVLAKMYVNHHG